MVLTVLPTFSLVPLSVKILFLFLIRFVLAGRSIIRFSHWGQRGLNFPVLRLRVRGPVTDCVPVVLLGHYCLLFRVSLLIVIRKLRFRY